MLNLKEIIEDNSTRWGRKFDIFIQLLIILSLVAFSVETIPDLKATTIKFLHYFEIFSITVFSIEYVLRFIVADKKLKYIFSFYGIIDLLAILPFYLSTGIDLRSLRVFRFLRIFRAFKLLRYSEAMKRFQFAIHSIKEELFLYMIITILMLFVSAVGIYYFEHPAQPEQFASVFDALWWAIATLTTVGYGDIYPITVGGRIFTFFILMIGLGIVAVPTGLLASSLTRKEEDK